MQNLSHISTREMNILFTCARTRWTDSADTRLHALIQQSVNWEIVLKLAERHYVVPLLRRNLQRMRTDGVPAVVMDNLRIRSKIIDWRNKMLVEELLRLADLLDARELPVIHYKGAIAAAMLYGDVSLRTYNDLDFLVRREDMQAVFTFLRDEGYSTTEEFDPKRRKHMERELKEYNFKSGHVSLEPHWSLTARRFPFAIDHTGLWQRARPFTLGEQRLLAFSPQDELLILCVVGSKGHWQRLQMVVDIAQCVGTHLDLDWDAICKQARELGSLRMLCLGLLLAGELLDAPIPTEVMSQARNDSIVNKLARQIVKLFVSEPSKQNLLPDTPHIFSSMLYQMRERPADRLQYLFRTMTTPTGMHLKRFPLPNSLFVLYHFIVPLHDYVLYPALRLGKKALAAGSSTS